jgi:hypothetical protein
MDNRPLGLMHFWQAGDAVTHSVAWLLLAMSVASWYFILSKAWSAWRMRRSARAALERFWSARTLDEAVEALERLLRLGLIHHATLRTATATATAPSKPDAATPRSPPPDYATVPVADALAQLRVRWGTMARAPAPTATTARNASALLNLTKPVHGGHLGDRASRSSFELGDHEAPSPLRAEERLSLQDKWSTAHLE